MLQVKTIAYSTSTAENHNPFSSSDVKGLKIIGIIQARETSKRFPQKIYKQLWGVPILFHVIDKAKQSRLMTDVVVASPKPLQEEFVENIENWVDTTIDENDVLSRYYNCAKEKQADYVVRLTSDCPLLDPFLIDYVIYHSIANSVDYGSNVLKLTFPDGLDTEVLNMQTLTLLNQATNSPYYREHVTMLIRENNELQDSLKCLSIESEVDRSKEKISVDTDEDLKRLEERNG